MPINSHGNEKFPKDASIHRKYNTANKLTFAYTFYSIFSAMAALFDLRYGIELVPRTFRKIKYAYDSLPNIRTRFRHVYRFSKTPITNNPPKRRCEDTNWRLFFPMEQMLRELFTVVVMWIIGSVAFGRPARGSLAVWCLFSCVCALFFWKIHGKCACSGCDSQRCCALISFREAVVLARGDRIDASGGSISNNLCFWFDQVLDCAKFCWKSRCWKCVFVKMFIKRLIPSHRWFCYWEIM